MPCLVDGDNVAHSRYRCRRSRRRRRRGKRGHDAPLPRRALHIVDVADDKRQWKDNERKATAATVVVIILQLLLLLIMT